MAAGSLWAPFSGVIAVLVVSLFILSRWKISRDAKRGIPQKDERVRRIEGKAALHTFYLGIAFNTALILYLGPVSGELGLPSIEAFYAVAMSHFVLAFSYTVLRRFYGGRENIE
ncbi:MAG: hypothetical protein PVJ38_02830 [Candidatus Bathyarchaeota archaeon]